MLNLCNIKYVHPTEMHLLKMVHYGFHLAIDSGFLLELKDYLEMLAWLDAHY